MGKVKKISLIFFYIIVWFLLLFCLLILISGVNAILNGNFGGGKKVWIIFGLSFATLFLLIYLVRKHFVILYRSIKKLFNFIKNIKLTLPATILLSCAILGGFFYASQVNKQKSIERQEFLKQTEERRIEDSKMEQLNKEYIVKRKTECYDLEQRERKNWNNVDGSFYREEDDICVVRYENKNWRDGDPNSCSTFEKLLNKNSKCTIEHYFTKEF